MRKNIRIGVVCLARKTYDYAAAGALYQKAREALQAIPDVDWTFIEALVIEAEDTRAAAARLSACRLDGMAVITGTFHLGHLALTLKRAVDVPTLLWAFEELPYNGGKIRLNSVCGLNLNASNLYKAGFDDVHCTVGGDIDMDWLNAVRMRAALAQSHIGLLGYRADGFFNLSIDELAAFSKTGILVDHFEISDVTAQEANSASVAGYARIIDAGFDCSGINARQKQQVAELCARFRTFMEKNALTAAAVRCWPEFANMYGISPCAAMSVLQSEGLLLGCEGDLEGVMSMVICDALGGAPPFLADLSQVSFEENHALLWHCGVAPINLCAAGCVPSLDTYFAGGRGVTSGFVLREGRVNTVRIDSARGQTRFFLRSGAAVPMEKLLTGTYGKVVYDQNIRALLDDVTSLGVAHHFSLVYGDYERSFKIFAKIMGYKLI
ncbi:MAG: fucose isomerase [Oscillospiraceae bacterium]|jgi:L-fucose isomerase-like protein|nr:fucose isomerase [Oscillospiraceae bacterium]